MWAVLVFISIMLVQQYFQYIRIPVLKTQVSLGGCFFTCLVSADSKIFSTLSSLFMWLEDWMRDQPTARFCDQTLAQEMKEQSPVFRSIIESKSHRHPSMRRVRPLKQYLLASSMCRLSCHCIGDTIRILPNASCFMLFRERESHDTRSYSALVSVIPTVV